MMMRQYDDINLPFGYLSKFSKRWMMGWMMVVHVPIPFYFFWEYLLGVLVDIVGQIVGGKLGHNDVVTDDENNNTIRLQTMMGSKSRESDMYMGYVSHSAPSYPTTCL